MTAPDLKPCPFCGGEAHEGFDGGYRVMKCDRCPMEVYAESRKRLVKVWNARATPAPSAMTPEVATWQPIKTAPKDGTKVILGVVVDGRVYVAMGSYSRKGQRIGWPIVPTAFRDGERPTHWFPLEPLTAALRVGGDA